MKQSNNRYLRCLSLLICFVMLITVCAALNGCTNSVNNEIKPTDASKENEFLLRNKSLVSKGEDSLENLLTNMNIEGAVGDILQEHDKVYIQRILDDNPDIFDGFEDQNDTTVFKVMWYGEFVGKILSGIAQMYLVDNDEETLAVGNSFTHRLESVQEENGYLGPWNEKQRLNKDTVTSLSEANGKWDTWCQYHCIYGLLRWYQVTGNETAFEVALKAADYLYEYFIEGGQTFISQKWPECNFAIGYMFALLYEYTADAKYLQASEYIVNTEWELEYLDFFSKQVISVSWMSDALKGIAFGFSNQPRWESLYSLSTLASLYRSTGDKQYYDALESLWWGIVQYDRHNIGSFGTGEGATGDPYGVLSETCNTVAWMAFSTEYLKCSKNSLAADELELSYFNATLGSLLGNNRDFIYANYSDGIREAAGKLLEHSVQGQNGTYGMTCCQASGTRGITSISEWAVLTGDNGLYLNYYGECRLQTYTDSGNAVTIKEETQYPKNGNILINVLPDKTESFTMFLRVPSWSVNTKIIVNGEEMKGIKNGEYYEITKAWQAGDVIEIQLDMSLHYWVADKKALGSKISVYYGPLLMAFEISDNIRKTVKFKYEDINNYSVYEDNKSLVCLQILTSAGKQVMFKNYAGTGKNGEEYCSWISVFADFSEKQFDRSGLPIWCNRQ